ncbi:MAG: Crp/Fnr family transcriptional regulator [Marinicaulis sp.]|nr:Crp/Fnr family transcriptional regulator [Marinicaulis sp.]NNE41008.1 Crp/Fnr family transcriptional regulator [Marinicaulis sp.]NNL89021.1 Crp/Fnr family transcriptional regulator [Marinicaulis sp.]
MSDLTDSLKWELKKNPLFQDLDDETFDRLLQSASPKIHKARSTVFHQGDAGGSMQLILSGQIKISTVNATGKECVLAFMGPGDVIGEMSMLDGGPRTASAVVMEQSRVLELTRLSFNRVLENNPSTGVKIIEILCKRLRATSAMVEDATLITAAPRLSRTLLRLAEQNGVEADGGTMIDLNLSQSTLGAYAGLLRESVNRQLRAWEAENIVAKHDNKIVILDKAALAEISESAI